MAKLMTFTKSFARTEPAPLDASEVYASLADATNYAGTDGSAYAGQEISVLVDGKYVRYVLQPKSDGSTGYTLEKVGVDASSVKQEVQIVESLPATGQEQGVLYINSTDKTGSIYNGTEYVQVFEHVDNISTTVSDVETLKGDSTVEGSVDNKIATALKDYSTTEDAKKEIAAEIAAAGHITRTVVDALPTSDIDASTIYMVKNADAADDSDQHYEEWMYINDKWEKIGDSAVDLSNYATKDDVTTAISNIGVSDAVQTAINTAKSEAISTAADDATTKANAAQAAGEKAANDVLGTEEGAKTTTEVDNGDGTKTTTVTYANTVYGVKAYAKDQADAAVETANAHTDSAISTVNTTLNNKLDTDKVGITFDETTTTIKDYVDAQDAKKFDVSKVGDIDFTSSDTPTLKAYIDKTATGEKQTENIQGIAEAKAAEVVDNRVGDLGTKEVTKTDDSGNQTTTTEKLTVKEYVDQQVEDNTLYITEF